MKLTGEEARAVVWDETDDWEPVSSKEIINTSRWSLGVGRVFKHIPTNKFYMFYWSEGATEQQEESPFEYENFYSPQKVVEKEVVVKKWVGVESE